MFYRCLLILLLFSPTQFFNWAQAAAKVGPAEAVAQKIDRLLIRPKNHACRNELVRFHAEQHCELLRDIPGLGNLQVLLAPRGGQLPDLIRRYRESGLVDYAEPDSLVRLASTFPNDPSLLDGTLWGLNNAGQNGGLPNADIDAPEAWSAIAAGSNVIVAVVDSGVRYTHEDLAGNMWTNPRDGSHGINARDGSTDPADDNGHGTLVAGVIGAVGDNNLGIVGVAWRVQLMACKFTDQFGNGLVSDALVCLDYARTNGAHIINASWGLDEISLSLSNAIAELRGGGILLVTAAGNTARDIDLIPRYPASFELDNIVAVAATTRRDALYPLSNFGAANVDLAAPGYEIYSTAFGSDAAYGFDEGTSMAAAYVSGASALLRAAYPTETPAQIIGRLMAAVDPLPALQGNCVSGGRLNLRKSLGVPVSAPMLQAAGSPSGGPLRLLLAGDPGRSYVIETTTDFLNWSPLSTNLTGLAGFFSVTDDRVEGSHSEFYRARLAP